ncbi:hypothetical protein BDV18DRAFT_124578 [Aspergillus unguis]
MVGWVDDKYAMTVCFALNRFIGLALAIISSISIGSSYVVTKKVHASRSSYSRSQTRSDTVTTGTHTGGREAWIHWRWVRIYLESGLVVWDNNAGFWGVDEHSCLCICSGSPRHAAGGIECTHRVDLH